jgi:alkanesulfonate monooxygenase SsuD/methylene tetrahydromethanopterin reductase-like flavin-dependent oxidoreductase (luciferase family)
MSALSFGVSLPSASQEINPVGMAIRAEQLGLDFVSASDHPAVGTPTYEVWTLLTWIAASTTRIRIATKVLGVPFRWPAMIAKMAETLDHLSGGRLILGLGGGADDDEIRSLGMGTRTPGEKVDGLEEAIRIIHGLWSEEEFSFQGGRYLIDGARMQPKPSHHIPIWLGTYGQRALELTGRLADGWIPSLGYALPQNIPAMGQRVLAATRKAGRRPDDVTFVCNLEIQLDGFEPAGRFVVAGSTAQIVERLRDIAGLGFTTMNFALAGAGQADQLERLATEIIPAIREALAGQDRTVRDLDED